MKKTLLLLVMVMTIHVLFAQHVLLGTCQNGGSMNYGSIFRTDINGANMQCAYSFDYTNGSMPMGSMVRAGNGNIYGVTYLGGYGDSCVIYEYNPVTGTSTDVFDLFQNPSLGWEEYSGMVLGTDGMLYGLCAAGGANSLGALFRFDPVTHAYTKLYDFNNATGIQPMCKPVQLSNGKLYGTCSGGGTHNQGTIFSYDITSNTYTDLHDFDTTHGAIPYYSGVLQASNGKLYGQTSQGGAHSLGVLYSFDPNTNTFAVLHSFDSTGGSAPKGDLMQATNGKIYGLTYTGGQNNLGVIYSFDISTNTFSTLHSFDSTGSYPNRGLMQASTGMLFGTATNGGTNSVGALFSFDITSNTFTKLYDFNYPVGAVPDCDIYEVDLSNTGLVTRPVPPGISLYPNPAVDAVFVGGVDGKTDVSYTLYDQTGRAVQAAPLTGANNPIDISALSPGIYMLSLKEGENMTTKKIVKLD